MRNPEPSTMSILVVRGPECSDAHARPLRPLPPGVLQNLVQRAGCAGKTIAVRSCGSTTEVINALRLANQWHVQATLLDPGTLVDSPLLHRALQGLSHPYVEVHDAIEDEVAALPPSPGKCLAVVNGYGARGYMLALDIALEHLGCAECECDVHVGT